LFSGPSSLDHLINSAIALGKEALAKVIGDVEDNLRFSIGKQLAIVAMRRDEALCNAFNICLDSTPTNPILWNILPSAR
jgi:hypothetical protein